MEFFTKLSLDLQDVLVILLRLLVVTDYDAEKLFKLGRGRQLRVSPEYLLVIHIVVQEVVGCLGPQLIVQSFDVVVSLQLSCTAFKSKGDVTTIQTFFGLELK